MSSIAIFNCDWSNRAKSINDGDKLANFLADMCKNDMGWPEAFSVCEIRLSAVELLAEEMGDDYEYSSEAIEYIQGGTLRGHLALFYDSTVLRAVSRFQISNIGKYGFQRFENIETGRKIVLACVHLPWTKGTQRALDLLQKAMEDEEDWANQISIFGDFNTYPAELEKVFPDFVMSIDPNEKTTKNKTSPDNFLYLEKVDSKSTLTVSIYDKVDELSHHPMLWVKTQRQKKTKGKKKTK